MNNRWQYAQGKHPKHCSCIQCVKTKRPKNARQSRSALIHILNLWRSKRFDPHFILGVTTDASQQQITQAHRRFITLYHPDRYNNDPIATELTKRLNAARDQLLGKVPRKSKSQRQQHRKQQETEQRAREAERRRQQREREYQAYVAEEKRRQEERRRQEEESEKYVHEAERIIRNSTTRKNRKRNKKQRNRVNEAHSAHNSERRQRPDEEQPQRTSQSETDKAQERQARARNNAGPQRASTSWWRKNGTSRLRQPPRTQYQSRIRSTSKYWFITTFAILATIVSYLYLTVEEPDTIDSLMNQWAALFDETLGINQ